MSDNDVIRKAFESCGGVGQNSARALLRNHPAVLADFALFKQGFEAGVAACSDRYACAAFDRPKDEGWKDNGACQHDSAKDSKCRGCWQRRKEEREIPTGDGGLK